MKFLIVLLAAVVTLQHQILTQKISEWTQFKTKYGKKYKNATEDTYRMSIYMENKRKIAELNKKGIYTMSINKYSDMLYQEFAGSSFGLNFTGFNLTLKANRGTFTSSRQLRLPSSVDWRTSGAVTPVKDQLQCGCCWSFSATGGLEGQYFRKTGILVPLSEQNLVDCSLAYGNYGCQGGLMNNAFQYVMDEGIDNEISYPFEGVDGPCRYDSLNSNVTNMGYVDIMEGNEMQLQEAVATIGPISVGVDASGWQFYKSGIFADPACSPSNLNHGVLVVGYGTNTNGTAYWIIKNSWGSSWGINGYIHLARNQNNMCGVATLASYPLV